MNNKKFKKVYQLLRPRAFNVDTYSNKLKVGIIYTLYFEGSNYIKLGFAENEGALDNKLWSEPFIILGRKKGQKKELLLLVNTLKELGIEYSENLNFKYSSSLMRHLSTLGWPVGKSLYQQRKIKKEILCA